MELPAPLAERIADGGEHLAITGASGWFGRVTLELLERALGASELARRVTAFASEAKTIKLRSGLQIAARPLAELVDLERPPDYLLHYAYLTRDRLAQVGVSDYVTANLAITLRVLEAIQRPGFRGLFYCSSGAARDGSDLYGQLKRLDELAFRETCRSAGASCVIARVFNVSGPYMTKPELYALGDLIAQARSGGPVTVKARNRVVRSYVAVADVVAVALAEMLESGEPREWHFDAAGEQAVEAGELAEKILSTLGRPDDPIVRSFDPTQPADEYLGDPRVFLDLAAHHQISLTSLDDQIRLTADG